MIPVFGYLGKAKLMDESVEIVRWVRPYGIPYAVLSCGKEVHQSCLEI